MDFFGVLVFFFKHRLQPGIFEEPLPSPIKGRLCQSFPQQKNTHPKKKKKRMQCSTAATASRSGKDRIATGA